MMWKARIATGQKTRIANPAVCEGNFCELGETKSVPVGALENGNPLWEAQLLSHLKLTNKRLGYLINFNVTLIKNGIKRMVI
jgi:hypothetical protein